MGSLLAIVGVVASFVLAETAKNSVHDKRKLARAREFKKQYKKLKPEECDDVEEEDDGNDDV